MESTVEKNACLDFAVRSLERVPTREESLKLSAYSTQTLVAAAKEATIEFADRVFNFCGITNAKSAVVRKTALGAPSRGVLSQAFPSIRSSMPTRRSKLQNKHRQTVSRDFRS